MTLRQSLPSQAQVWDSKASEWHVQCHSVLGKSAFSGATGILFYQVEKPNLKMKKKDLKIQFLDVKLQAQCWTQQFQFFNNY